MSEVLRQQFAARHGLHGGSDDFPRSDIRDELVPNPLRFNPRGGFGSEFLGRAQALFLFPLFSIHGVPVGVEPITIGLE